MTERTLPELLAPAGNFEALRAAIAMGADAVYLSGKSFGARSYADNFADEELREAVRYAHLRGKAIHVTVNTLLGDKELAEAERYLSYLEEIGADAVIIQDLSVAELAAKAAPDLKRHASTQMTIHSLGGAKKAEELGFDRVVLSRELSLKEIENISQNCGTETEIFVHGAMCMSYSGQCLFSSVLGGRSGNRGKCAQPCRQLYSARGKNEKYYLSLKDMCLAEHIPEIIKSGAASLKIEGRMKGAAYVAAVTKVYRRCLDECRAVTSDEYRLLERIFYRGGLSCGYFENKIGPKMFAFDRPEDPYKKDGGMLAAKITAETNEKIDEFKIRLTADAVFRRDWASLLRLFSHGKIVAEVSGAIPQKAQNKPMDEEYIKARLSKTGGTIFELEDIQTETDNGIYLSAKDINALRRAALAEAEDNIIALNAANAKGFENSHIGKEKYINKYKNDIRKSTAHSAHSGFYASVASVDQFSALTEYEKEYKNSRDKYFELIAVPSTVLLRNAEYFQKYADRVIIDPPAIMRDAESSFANINTLKELGFHRLIVHNLGGIIKGFELFGSPRMNITNSAALDIIFRKFDLRMCALSPELSLPQIRDMIKTNTAAVSAYGYQPIMLTENCITKNIGGCPCGDNTAYLTDRKNAEFPIMRDGAGCRSVLLNSRPTFMADKMHELRNNGIDKFILNFTVESADEVKTICDAYIGGSGYMPKEYTRLHFYSSAITESFK